MTVEEHIEKHKKLHTALDELAADYVLTSPKGRTRLLSETSLMEFIIWSAEQTKNPEVVE